MHGDLVVEMNDAWWIEASMSGFVPPGTSYRADDTATRGRAVFVVTINEICPVRRNADVSIFNGNDEHTAQVRVVSILKAFGNNDALPPVEVVEEPVGGAYRYRLVDGTHRFYCSMFAGFMHIPAVMGFDPNAMI